MLQCSVTVMAWHSSPHTVFHFLRFLSRTPEAVGLLEGAALAVLLVEVGLIISYEVLHVEQCLRATVH